MLLCRAICFFFLFYGALFVMKCLRWTELSNSTHYNENPIYVFPEKELRGLSPNFHIHVSYSQDRSTSFPAAESAGRSWEYINRSQTHECGNRNLTDAAQFLFWEYLFRIFGIVSLQCGSQGYKNVQAVLLCGTRCQSFFTILRLVP